jgi:hypothetical protein
MDDPTTVTAACDRDAAYGAVAEGLAATGFDVTWGGDGTATAERGSKGKSLVLGALSKDTYMRLTLVVQSGGDGTTITLMPATSGLAGGLIGMRRSKKAFAATADAIRAALAARGGNTRGGEPS